MARAAARRSGGGQSALWSASRSPPESAAARTVTYADDLTPMSTSAPLGSKPITEPVVRSPRAKVGIVFMDIASSSYENSAESPSQPSSGSYARPAYRERRRSSRVILPAVLMPKPASSIVETSCTWRLRQLWADEAHCGSCPPVIGCGTKAASAPSSEESAEAATRSLGMAAERPAARGCTGRGLAARDL